jgi:hypothetical protein
MKKTFLKLTAFIVVVTMTLGAKASDPVADMMRSGVNDLTKMASLQLTPLGNSFAAGLGGGWYNTAKPHKLLGFDLTVSLNLATIPDADKVYDFASQGFQALSLASGTNAQMPTLIAYDDAVAPSMILKTKATNVSMDIPASISGDPIKLALLNAFLSGQTDYPATISGGKININAPAQIVGDPIQIKGMVPKALPFVGIPTPTAQLGIGLVYNTDIMIRYMPSINAGDFSISMWGVGVKHDIKQWIPAIKELPFFDLSGLFGYTKLTTSYALSVTPSMYGISGLVDNSAASSWSGQKMEVSASALTCQVLISKGLLLNIFTPYIGLGFTSSNFEINMKGRYPLIKSGEAMGYDPFIIDETSATNPISLNPAYAKLYADDNTKDVDYMEPGKLANSSVFMPNATIGLRLKLLILTIHAQYTLQKYSMFSAGVGFAIR